MQLARTSPAKVAKRGEYDNDDDDDPKPGRHGILSLGARADSTTSRPVFANRVQHAPRTCISSVLEVRSPGTVARGSAGLGVESTVAGRRAANEGSRPGRAHIGASREGTPARDTPEASAGEWTRSGHRCMARALASVRDSQAARARLGKTVSLCGEAARGRLSQNAGRSVEASRWNRPRRSS